ncbi:polysaccharide deacetylase family protein [Lactococcus cremoris]|uniref:polysaccharide deacetylase family protein n=1 Tax=Lactococcus lactis subsp. cremoris TaxID=1359 RepID=UPI001C2631A4|nr:polysaccharide deacetylase family protein [Lactococcus cremoris]MBU8903899.1 polysaccharide deacetylase family protein [Lactococcus cremoris]MCT0487723.1 polysaccharide deacetylase family protein [Lactococcus cremoris]MCT4454266.1 polysaccharide deacetylase family protein [Lactococcus cremoris]
MKKRVQSNKKRIRWASVLTVFVLLIGIIAIAFAAVHLLSPKANTSQKSSQTSRQEKTKSTVPSSSSQPKETKWLTGTNENQLPILMFHYVTSRADQLPQDSNNINIVTFEKELKVLKSQGYTTVSGTDAQKILTTKEKPSDKMVWLTFDDGSVTMYTDIFPLLKKYNMHATNFIITGFVNKAQGGILSWEQIKEMKASGLVDFGSHTVSHPDLGTQTLEDQRTELEQSKADLDKNLNQQTNMICYPAGGYNQNTLSLSTELGYKFGLLDPGRNGVVAQAAKESDGLLTLPRFRMMSSTTAEEMMQMIQPATDYNEKNK